MQLKHIIYGILLAIFIIFNKPIMNILKLISEGLSEFANEFNKSYIDEPENENENENESENESEETKKGKLFFVI